MKRIAVISAILENPEQAQAPFNAIVAGNNENSPTKRLTMGYTTIYPTGSTTGHTHEDMEETYFVISGKGVMVVGEDEFEIEQGDALYVPPGEFHTTYQRGNMPLVVLWVTGKVD
jgi:mannose-6-phosphate isomerase-like protein (cupin superfamily)